MLALDIITGLLALWALLRFLPAGWDGYGPLPYLISFIRFLWMPAALCLIAAVAMGIVPAGVVAAAIIVVVLAVNSPNYRRLPHHGTDRSARRDCANDGDNTNDGAQTLSVMTLNCRYGRASAQAIVEAVRTRHIDVLALQELTQGLVDALDSAGLADLLPYRQLGAANESDNGGFNGIWSSAQPVASSPSAVELPAAAVPTITIASPDGSSSSNGSSTNGTITFASAHPKSPMRGCREWSTGVRALGRLSQTDHMHAATVVMGDLNSSLSHPSFRALLRSGKFTDAGLTERHSTIASFPSWLTWPRLELDHILVTDGLTASNTASFPIAGSDHLALIGILQV